MTSKHTSAKYLEKFMANIKGEYSINDMIIEIKNQDSIIKKTQINNNRLR